MNQWFALAAAWPCVRWFARSLSNALWDVYELVFDFEELFPHHGSRAECSPCRSNPAICRCGRRL